MSDVPTLDCEDCGTGIEFVINGKVQPDAEVSCPTCGAVHVVDFTDGDGEQPDVHLTLLKHGAEVIAELKEWKSRGWYDRESLLEQGRVGAADMRERAAQAVEHIYFAGWSYIAYTIRALPLSPSPSREACPACGRAVAYPGAIYCGAACVAARGA